LMTSVPPPTAPPTSRHWNRPAMHTLFIPVFLFSLLTSTVFSQSNFTINTPANIVQCEPILLSWVGGTPPYFLSVLPAGQPSANALVSFLPQNGTSFTWKVNVTQGVGIFFNLRDDAGLLAQSGSVTVQSNPTSDNSCINASAVVPIPSTSASGSTASVSGSNSAVGASTTGATGGSSTQVSKGSSSTSTGATASPSKAGAATHYASVGTLAMTGAALAFALVL